jgi:Domain of unknown function (DUF4062)
MTSTAPPAVAKRVRSRRYTSPWVTDIYQRATPAGSRSGPYPTRVPNVYRVFIASAKGVLVEYRRAVVEVCQRIGLTAVHMDQFYPDELPPIDVCRRYVETTDAVVLIIAHRYGSRPPGQSLSFTELEYDHALSIGRPVYPWVADEEYWATAHPDDQYDDEAATRRFIGRLNERHTVKPLQDVSDFKLDLTARLSALMGRHGGHAPFSFGGRTHPDPHALAVAMAADWASATAAFASVHERTALADWLRHAVGDRTYPTNLLTRPLTGHTDVDVAILDFVAHFAPDVRPMYWGRPVDAPGLAALCAHAVHGDPIAVALLSRLTGAMMERFARHRCQAGHEGCNTKSCVLLRGAWRVVTAGLDALATLLAPVDAVTSAFPPGATYFGQPLSRFAGLAHWGLNGPPEIVVARLAATVMRAAVDPAYLAWIEREYQNLARVPRPSWWDRLRARAKTASGAERTALVVAATVLAPIAAERARRLRRRRLFIGIGSLWFLGVIGVAGIVFWALVTLWPP